MAKKGLNCRSRVFLAIMISCCILGSQGIKFPGKMYVFLLTMGTPEGEIGKVQIKSNSEIFYSILGNGTSFINIDGVTGTLILLKDVDEMNIAQINNTQLTIQAKTNDQSKMAFTKVLFIILPSACGDQFVHATMKNIVVKSNHIFNTTAGRPLKVSAASLHRFLREIPVGDSAKDISIAQMKIEKAIEVIKRRIINIFENLFGTDVVVYALFHVKNLFSEVMMEEMESDAGCVKANIVDPTTCQVNSDFRTFDGTCNNLNNPNWGASDTAFIRILPALYFDVDGLNDPIGFPNQPNAPDVPSAFEVSRDFIKDEVASASSPNLTHAVMQFGQFLDHDLDLAVDSEGSDECSRVRCDGSPSDFQAPCYPILPISNGQPPCIRVIRSAAVCQEKGYPKTREQINVNTHFLDASQIYGSTKRLADFLRQNKTNDQGLLRSSSGIDGELLPLDTSQNIPDQLCDDFGGCFIAGDARANEQQALAAFQSLFLREHNRIARTLKTINNHWDGEMLYQETRRIIVAMLQKITYKDYLPKILGRNPLPPYTGYNSSTNPGISNPFATGAYRFGHSAIRSEFELLDTNFDLFASINLRFMFFNNTVIQKRGIRALLLGLVGNFSENVDRTLSPGIVRDLFQRANSPGQNLAALNIQRWRDHGLPGYNEYRKLCGLSDAMTFEDTKNEIKDPENRKILKRLYNDNPNLVELWVAGLAETPVDGGSVGRIFKCIIVEQFLRTRDSDRFFYENIGVFRDDQLGEIAKGSLSSIYCDNLKDIVSIQKDAFMAPTDRKPRISCYRIPRIDLCAWKDNKHFPSTCLNGLSKLRKRTGKCYCKCTRPWSGTRCERKRTTRAVKWQVSILSNGKVICSGALLNKEFVLTTRYCMKKAENAQVRLADFRKHLSDPGERTVNIRSVRYPPGTALATSNVALVRMKNSITFSKEIKPITIDVLSRTTSHLSVWGGGRILQTLHLTMAKQRACKKVFTLFDKKKEVCSLKASFPYLTSLASGSPLVQYRGSKAYLVGLLTSVERVNRSSQPRFARYIRLSKFLPWLMPYLDNSI